MSIPKLTLNSVKSHISLDTYNVLESYCNDSLLAELSSPNGISRIYKGVNVNVRMGWHRDEANIISGLFMRIYGNNFIEASIITKDSNKRDISIDQHDTFEFPTSLIDSSEAERLFAVLNSEHGEKEIIKLEIENIKKTEEIKAFFMKNQDMLPESFKEKIFPKPCPNPTPSNETNNGQNFFIITIVVIIAGVIVVSAKYFSNRTSK